MAKYDGSSGSDGSSKKDDKEDDSGEDTFVSSGDGTVDFVLKFRSSSKLAKWNRTMQTRENWDSYWGRHNFSHKMPGQSKEVLSMQPMAVEQTAAFFQQALVSMGDGWWSADARAPGAEDTLKVSPDVIRRITQAQLQKAGILKHVVRGIKSGLLGGKIITKVHGYMKPIPKYVAERSAKGRSAKLSKATKYGWTLCLDLVSDFNFYPDPTGEGLGECEDMYMDYHKVLALSEGDDAIYDKEVVEQLKGTSGEEGAEERFDEMRRTNQMQDDRNYRNRIKLTEYWGTVLGDDGEVLHENCVVTVANDKYLIRKPTPNPLWHQKSPYIETFLLDAPFGVQPKALMDAPTKHNIAANEIYNLMVDGAMRAANGVTQIRQDWLEDPSQVQGGIKPGTTLGVSAACPPGAKVLDLLETGEVPAEAMNMFNVMQQEFNRAALTSDIRQGMQPRKDVPATQIVEANQTITSVFSGLSANIEQSWIQTLLERSWETCAQFSDDMDEDEVRTVLGDKADDFLKLTAEERFAETVGGIKFTVSGISLTLQKAQDFKKIMTLLQTLGGSQVLEEEFVKKFSFSKLLVFGMRSLGIRTDQLEISQSEQEQMQAPQPPAGSPQPGQPQGAGGMSQVPSPNTGSLSDQLGQAAGPQAQPGSPAQ